MPKKKHKRKRRDKVTCHVSERGHNITLDNSDTETALNGVGSDYIVSDERVLGKVNHAHKNEKHLQKKKQLSNCYNFENNFENLDDVIHHNKSHIVYNDDVFVTPPNKSDSRTKSRRKKTIWSYPESESNEEILVCCDNTPLRKKDIIGNKELPSVSSCAMETKSQSDYCNSNSPLMSGIDYSSHVLSKKRKKRSRKTSCENGNAEVESVIPLVATDSCKTSENVSRDGDDMHENLQKHVAKSWIAQPVEDLPHYDFSEIADISEDPVEFEIPLLHATESVNHLTKTEKEELLSQGVTIYTGRWTKHDESLLQENWLSFSKRYKVSNPCLLLGVNSCKKTSKVTNFNRAKHFYVRLGKGLGHRTLHSVYKKAKILLDPRYKEKKYIRQDLAKIKQLHSLHGSDWNKISLIMNRPPHYCATSFRNHEKELIKGQWLKEEQKSLRKAVKKFVPDREWLRSIELCKSIPWEKVSKIVGTRTAIQCYEHWFGSKKLHSKKKTFVNWNDMYSACLIYLLYHNLVSDVVLVDWLSLYPFFKDCLPSHKPLIQYWGRLRRRVGLHNSTPYAEMVCHMYFTYLPLLLRKLNLTLKDIIFKLQKDINS